GRTESITNQGPATKAANDQKNEVCTSTCNRINFALGLDKLDDGVLGARWVTEFTTCIDVVDQGVVFHDMDGRSHAYPLPKQGK
ncbi:DUF6531 domain-containing protein, partial [Pseudomonas sp. VA159-2]|uniref:DUF6531 domain-containing protein n=1 Tax=Pseudomonas sp. VA159-2 TaxID=2956728 RepID=UPI0020982962